MSKKKITKKGLKELILECLMYPNKKVKVNTNYSISSWWEERDEITESTDIFTRRENGKEYWLTLTLWYKGNGQTDFSPSIVDIDDKYEGMTKFFLEEILES